MKLFGILLVFISCSMCGFIIDWQENKRIKELEKFIYVFELLKAEIDYRLTPLKEACLDVAKLSPVGIRNLFETFAKALDSKSSVDLNEMWTDALDTNKHYFHLNAEDIATISRFSNACGYLDKNMQKKNIDMLIYKLQEEFRLSQNKYLKNTKLNKYLGVLIGTCISIFLV